ncbi:MAG: thioesterase family protein [Gammaproteobacteria bacterium]|nr:thioesterase family protein [Gammaproteobacteria bacterium]
MAAPYRIAFTVRWADLDPNGHMRHTAYMDYAAQARLACLADLGFTLQRFHTLQLGPILFREDSRYLHEVRANERITVTAAAVGQSPNKKHWRIRHQILCDDGTLACVVDCQGAWFDIVARRVVPAPPELDAALQKMPKAEDYADFIPR